MIGKTILHYKIIEKLGEGGMGVVYLAEDSKLDRQVAIKFLPHHIAVNSDERKRFEIEAKAAAALNHNNIATIHAIEEVDEDIFLVMEYIKGKHLKDYINAKPLAAKKATDIAIQIAEGLQAAHKKGIVHRDIKSANIMSDDEGKIKIMDFGLAKFAGSAELTQVGTTLGTAAYMSPEQAKGGEVDQRADIWSLAVVLYEMLTGTLPFKGEYEQAVIFSILNEDVHFPENISQKMKTLLHKALAKDRSERYQSVTELLNDLKDEDKNDKLHTNAPIKNSRIKLYALSAFALLILVYVLSFLIPAVETNAEVKRIAVLPLKNLGSSEQDYFADGLTGEITSKLSSLSGLSVIARSSAMQYKNTQKPLQQIAEELGVHYVLEGTVQWEEMADGLKRIRVNPELIEIKGGSQIWSKPYEADFSSAFKLQADIASTVASALNVTLFRSEQKSLESKITDNSEAYDLYLRAVGYAEDITNETNSRIAEQMLKNAIGLDNNFAAAYAALSSVQSDMYWQYFERNEEILNHSEANARKALAIDPDLPIAHVALGDYHYHGRLNYEPAFREYKQALKLQPNNVEAHNGIGFVLRRQGKMEEAISYFKITMELDPLNYTTVWSIAETHLLLKEYDTGMQFLEQAISIAPGSISPYLLKSRTSVNFMGNTKEARKILVNANKNKIGTDDENLKYQLYLLDLFEGKFSSALQQIKNIKEVDDQFFFKPEDLLAGFAHRFAGNATQAKTAFELAIARLLQKIKEHPEDSRLYTSLGLAYAGLGQKGNALREGKKGVELLSMEREAWRGSHRLLDLAHIYAMVDEPGLALVAIEKLLASPTDALSVWLLKLDPHWDPLRGNPEFKKLIVKYSTEN